MLGARISIAESFNENELIWLLDATRSIEPKISWFVASGPREVADPIDPFATAFWAHIELHND